MMTSIKLFKLIFLYSGCLCVGAGPVRLTYNHHCRLLFGLSVIVTLNLGVQRPLDRFIYMRKAIGRIGGVWDALTKSIWSLCPETEMYDYRGHYWAEVLISRASICQPSRIYVHVQIGMYKQGLDSTHRSWLASSPFVHSVIHTTASECYQSMLCVINNTLGAHYTVLLIEVFFSCNIKFDRPISLILGAKCHTIHTVKKLTFLSTKHKRFSQNVMGVTKCFYFYLVLFH